MLSSVEFFGLFPRSETLIEKTRSYERGRAALDDVQRQIAIDTQDLVSIQRKLGFRIYSDGALAWQDQIRPIIRSLTGISPETRYSRWFDTNTFYQKPIVKDRISLGKVAKDNFINPNSMPEAKKWKISIPGPYSLAQLSDNQYYKKNLDLILDIAIAENQLLKYLAAEGIALFELVEPCLVYQPYRDRLPSIDELSVALSAINRTVQGLSEYSSVQTYFGDASPILQGLLDLDIGGIGFDVFETEYAKFKVNTSKTISLGIVDSRDSNIEDPKWIKEKAREVEKHIASEKIILTPNSDLKFVPRSVAVEKLAALSEARQFSEVSD